MQKLEGKVSALAFGGEGVIKPQEKTEKVIFVPFVASGEEVQVEIVEDKKNFRRARLLNVLKPSSQRVEPSCQHFGVCGGCQFQHLSYEAQLDAKKQFIKDAFTRIGKVGLPDFEVVGAKRQYAYRRSVSMTLHEKKLGYRDMDGQFFSVKECPIAFEKGEFSQEKFMKKEFPSEGRITFLKSSDGWITNREETLKFSVMGLEFHYKAETFVQNHPELSEKMAHYVVERVLDSHKKKALDLYCGIGVTAQLLAHKGIEVTGVEINAHSIDLGKQTAKQNGVNVVFKAMDVEKFLMHYKGNYSELIVVNPPRGGLTPKIVEKLSLFSSLIYVSCMPPTMARDFLELSKQGWKIESLKAFDQFPQTTHVETIVYATR